jgi:hypothetical protein
LRDQFLDLTVNVKRQLTIETGIHAGWAKARPHAPEK